MKGSDKQLEIGKEIEGWETGDLKVFTSLRSGGGGENSESLLSIEGEEN